jgi:hypothetical protein
MDFGQQAIGLNSSAAVFPPEMITAFWVVGFLGCLALIIFIILLILKQIFASHKVYPGIFHKKIFMLTVPQRLNKEEDKDKKPLKEIIATIETFYANLGGLKAHRGFKTWLFGRYDSWSFEIVVGADRLITFYMAVPVYLEDYIKQQILSQYPYAQIEEVEDYNIFKETGYVAAGYVKLIKEKMFPILTYKSMEVDPLINVLSSLAKLPEGETIAIQFLMRSAYKDWRKNGVKIASKMQQGNSYKKATTNNSNLISLMTPTGPKDDKPKDAYRLSPMEDQMVKSIEEKASKAGMDVNIRLISFAETETKAKNTLRDVANSFSQYSNYQYANGFKAVIKGNEAKIINNFIYRLFDESTNCVLNTEEMASLWHLPFPNTEVPNIRWLMARRLPPPLNLPSEGVILGENTYRGSTVKVRIKEADRRRHMYIIGMTGTGKSTTMSTMAIQDIIAGKGVCVIDPHGNLIEDILPYIPKERAEDVIIFDPSDTARPIGLNMLDAKELYEMDQAAQEMITIFYKLLPDPAMAGPMFEHYMRNALLALMADSNNPCTLVELARIFTDDAFRKEKLTHVTDILVKDFWEREYVASQKGSSGADMLSYVISKTGRFVENELMRNIIGQGKSGINFRDVMDNGKILLMNLSKGKIGDTNSSLLGLIAVSKLQMAALARADMPEEQRRDFYLYIDEFQNFITDSISIILAEARKYKLNLVMAHQYISQLVQGNNDTKVKDAVFGNVGTMISYRIGVDDSEVMAKQLAPTVGEYDLINVEKYNAYVRLLIDNTAADTFNMKAYHPSEIAKADKAIAQPLKELSRFKYGRDRQLVIREILERSRIGQLGKPVVPVAPPRV